MVYRNYRVAGRRVAVGGMRKSNYRVGLRKPNYGRRRSLYTVGKGYGLRPAYTFFRKFFKRRKYS